MELNVISDDSCDADIKVMRSQLIEFGLDEENLSKAEMSDLLKALNNSKSTITEDDLMKNKVSEPASSLSSSISSPASPKPLKRHYKNVKDRRMPWSILPPDITQAEKARVLSVYIKLMSIKRYWQARQIPNFVAWPPSISIVDQSSTSRIQSLRSTRSGRSVPVYSELVDDDSSDNDFVVTKSKKRKVSGEDHADGIYTNKVISLKRKQTRDEGNRPAKECKVIKEVPIEIVPSTSTSVRTRLDKIFSMIDD